VILATYGEVNHNMHGGEEAVLIQTRVPRPFMYQITAAIIRTTTTIHHQLEKPPEPAAGAAPVVVAVCASADETRTGKPNSVAKGM